MVLKKNIHGLVNTIPARLTRIVADLAKLDNVATFYAFVAEEREDAEGNETFDGAVGLLRYLIAHGDTCVQKYRAQLGLEQQADSGQLESVERNKYLVYAHFEQFLGSCQQAQSAPPTDVIEIEWD